MSHPFAELISTVLDVVAAFLLAADAFGQEILQKTICACSAILADLDKITKSELSATETFSLIGKSFELHTTPIVFVVLMLIMLLPGGFIVTLLLNYFDNFWDTWLPTSVYLTNRYVSLLAHVTLVGISLLVISAVAAWTLPRPLLLLTRLIVSGLTKVQSRVTTRGMLALIGISMIVINHAVTGFLLK